MKKLTFENILDQRKLSTHVYFFLLSLITVGLTMIFNEGFQSWNKSLSLLLLIFIQLEVFIFLGFIIFRDFKPVSEPKVVTRLILSRFVIFYIACFASAFVLIIAMLYAEHWIIYHDTSKVINNFFHYEFWGWFKTTTAGLSVGAIIFIYVLWQDALKREQKLKEENLVFQNETLKNQVNPHFLFNSLNTISSLVQSQPGTAEKFINNLSSVYRYILENGQRDKVPLKSELDFIIGYFNLYKIRDEEKIILNIEDIDSGMFEILPVSLQILLENGIKHNIATRENPLRISIYIEGQYIVVKNNLQKKATQFQSTKIGLKNLYERIKLTTGRDLIIEETNNYFIVKLPLLK